MDIYKDFDYTAYINEQIIFINKEKEDLAKDKELLKKEKLEIEDIRRKYEAKMKLEYLIFKRESNYYVLIKEELKDIAKKKVRLNNGFNEVVEEKKKIELLKKKLKEEFKAGGSLEICWYLFKWG
ncbi:MAG: hypothetical protein WCL51_15855, partial [Bacteroidota bacterium]